MFRLAHISDLHLPFPPQFSIMRFANKRITGYLNWKFNRRHSLAGEYLQTLMDGLKQEKVDHTIISGDLTNLSLPEEFSNALNFLEGMASPDQLTAQFGNHDAYVPGALKSAMASWMPYAKGDVGDFTSERDFPVVRVRGQIAIIACNSAVATPPFFATGQFKADQASRLENILEKYRDYCRIVSIHHPPLDDATSWHKRLVGKERFANAIRNRGADLVLHGHTHLATINTLDGPDGNVPVVCVPAAGNGHLHARPAGRFNIFSIEKKKGKWTINLEAKACNMDMSGLETVLSRQL